MKPFHCRTCQHELGRTDGRRLVLGVAVAGSFVSAGTIYRHIAIECPSCAVMTSWQPIARGAMIHSERVAA